jgi:hypothetical protein
MKKILIRVVVVIIAFLMLGIIRDQVIKTALTVTASQITGAPVHIDGFSLGIFNQSVKISGFRMYNPKGFSRGILADLPKIRVKYDLGALLKKRLYLVNLEVELKEIGLEKNKEGILNVDSLKVVKEGKNVPAKKGAQMPMQIDTLKLGMGRIVSRDYSGGKSPVVNVYDINIHKEYKNITSAQSLAALILAEPMKSAGIRGAKIYGAAMLAGVAVLPVAAAFTLAGRDSAAQDYAISFDEVYEKSLMILKQMGQVKSEDKAAGVISGSVNSADITLRVTKKSANNTTVTVSARKYFLPKPEIAGGILYNISEKLK